MVRNVQTTTTNGLRKNRITQKTRLRVVRGQLDEDAIIFDDEEERNRVLASQGVDAEDANEHHLQAVLNAANVRKPAGGLSGKHSVPEAHIPTPDAAGVVESYESLYQSGKYKQPTTHLRFSGSVEESTEGGLAGGFTYFLDERDAEWINKSNQEARGEGTSASANGQSGDSPSSTRSGRALHNRGAKGKGKEPEQLCGADPTYSHIVVDEDEFELVMGLFEKLTEDKFPFIHLDLDAFPPFSDYETVFSASLPPATFANYIVPSSVPPPDRIVRVARTVYPYWRQRKIEREGKRVVPQLDYDDSQESSYICFRRRDVKPIRRTRASSTAYTDKLARLRSELQMGFDLARMVLEREELKKQDTIAAKDVWQARYAFADAWRGEESVSRSELGVDEALLYDKERVVKKPKVEGLGLHNRIILGLNKRSSAAQSALDTPNRDSHSPLTAHLELPGVNITTLSPIAYVAVQSAVHQRYLDVQVNVEKEMASLRARDAAWEDLVDMPVQALPISHPDKLFRPYTSPSSHSSPPTLAGVGIDPAVRHLNAAVPSSASESIDFPGKATAPPMSSFPPLETPGDQLSQFADDQPIATLPTMERHPRSLRLRTGRGGRLHLDRRLHVRHVHPLLRAEQAGWPAGNSSTRQEELEMTETTRWRGRDWCPEARPATNKRKAPSSDELGQGYRAHGSIYENGATAFSKRRRYEEAEEAIGFEQSGYGLGLATYAEWEKGPAEDDKRSFDLRSPRSAEPQQEPLKGLWPVEGPTEEDVERAWRIDEQWRYDSDMARDGEDRFLLDDFQPKFLRTMVTLLDASDHEAIKTDAKYLTSPLIPSAGPKPFPLAGRLTDQDRGRLTSFRAMRTPQPLAQTSLFPQSQPVSIPKLPLQPLSITTPPPTPPVPQQVAAIAPSAELMEGQIRRVTRPPHPQAHSESPSASPVPATPQTPRGPSVSQQSPPTPSPSLTNGFHTRPISLGNGLSGEDGATVRVSSSMRPKVHTPGLQQQGTLGHTVNGFDAQTNGAFPAHQPQNQTHMAFHPGHVHGLNPQQYAALRNVFGAQHQHQQQQQQQQARPQMAMQMQMNGLPANGNINLQMGPGNLNLKLPPSRLTQMRMNGNAGKDVNGVGGGGPPVPMHTSLPRPNVGGSPIPHARTPSANGHIISPSQGRLSPANMHLGHTSPLGHAALASSPHHHPGLVALPLHATTPPRPAPTLMHQQMVGASGQGHEYS